MGNLRGYVRLSVLPSRVLKTEKRHKASNKAHSAKNLGQSALDGKAREVKIVS